MSRRADIAIIGAGIAGASLAAEIAGRASVLLIEGESQPGYHSTGRSASFWSESYGGPLIQPLTTASGPFLAAPPAEFHSEPFLRQRGAVHIADEGGRAVLDRMLVAFGESGVTLEPMGRSALEALIPGLRPGWDQALFEPSCADIDVAALHAAYLRAARKGGVALLRDSRLERAERIPGGWRIETGQEAVQARILVNAAGAWADEVARRSDEATIGLQPYRRTIAQLRVDPPALPDSPLTIDARGRFYFKPEAGGRLWLSPHDETACDPCDAAADDYDVALAIDRFEKVADWRIQRLEHSWAGLRSFVADRRPVYGFARGRKDFFWCAGQGGFGIQTAPAAAKLAASLLLESAPDPMVAGIDPAPYSAARFTA